jgi:hypothetical protein
MILGCALGVYIGSENYKYETPVVSTKALECENITVNNSVESKEYWEQTSVDGRGNDNKNDGDFLEISNLNNGLSIIIESFKRESYIDDKTYNEIKWKLIDLVMDDDAAMQELLDVYKYNLYDREATDSIQELLLEIKTEEMQSFVEDLVTLGNKESQIAGLNLLSDLQMQDLRSLAIVTDTIALNNHDPEVLISALHAFPGVSLSPEESKDVLQDLSLLANHYDEKVRLASLMPIATWARNADQLDDVLEVFKNGESQSRAAAAAALEQSPIKDRQLKNIYLEIMGNDSSPLELRRLSASLLDQFDLSQVEYEKVTSLTDAQGS